MSHVRSQARAQLLTNTQVMALRRLVALDIGVLSHAPGSEPRAYRWTAGRVSPSAVRSESLEARFRKSPSALSAITLSSPSSAVSLLEELQGPVARPCRYGSSPERLARMCVQRTTILTSMSRDTIDENTAMDAFVRTSWFRHERLRRRFKVLARSLDGRLRNSRKCHVPPSQPLLAGRIAHWWGPAEVHVAYNDPAISCGRERSRCAICTPAEGVAVCCMALLYAVACNPL